MATTVARLQAVLGADTGQFDRAMDKSHSRFGKVSKAAGIAGAAIAGGLAVGLTKSVHAAMQAEESQGRLEIAYKRAGINALLYAKRQEKLLDSGRKLGFTNSQQRDALGSLVVATGSYNKAAHEMAIAEDIARFKHVDLTQATKMLTMAQAGSQRATKQLGLSVQASTENADKAKLAYRAQKDALDEQYPSLTKMTEAQKAQYYAARDAIDQQYAGAKAAAQYADKQVTAGKVIDLVRKKLHGQAEEFSQTAAGRVQVFQAQIGALEGELGKALLPAIVAVTEKLTSLTEFFNQHKETTQILIGALAALSGILLTVSVSTKIATAATKIYRAATLAATAAQWLLNAAVEANPYVLAATAIAGLVAALVVLQLKYHAVTKAVDFLKDHLYILMAVPVVGWLATGIAYAIKYRNAIGDAADKVANAFTAALKPFQKAIAAIQAAFAGVRTEVHTLLSAISRVIDAFKWIIDNVKRLGGALGGIAGAVGGVAGKFGDASSSVNQFRKGPGGVSGVVGGSGAKEGQQFGVGRQLWDEIGMGEALGLRVTSGFRPGAHTKHGTLSDHARHAAVDMSGSARGMAALFMKLVGRKEIRQAFYDPLGSIFNGVRSSYREGGHSDHIHIAEYDKGGFLRPGWNLAFNGLGRPEPVGGDVTIPIYLGGEQIATVVFDMLRRRARSYEKRNLRGAFGNI